MNYQAAQKTFFRVNYGEGYRFPTIGERYVDDGVSMLRVFPNPDLKTEFGWTAELGVKQGFKKIANWNGQLDYALFLAKGNLNFCCSKSLISAIN